MKKKAEETVSQFAVPPVTIQCSRHLILENTFFAHTIKEPTIWEIGVTEAEVIGKLIITISSEEKTEDKT